MMSDRPIVHILIVDDDQRNLSVLESVLDSPGYQLVRATSGDEALLVLMNQEFAVLVLDVQMPGMSGMELAKLVKQRRRTAHIPIIFLTAYEEGALLGYDAGAVDFLHKPVNPAVLRSKVAVFAELHRKGVELKTAYAMLLAEVDERRLAEARLAKLNASLDQRVRERTQALQESETRLREADRQKDEFLATLAHELRNPLAPLRNAVHLLKTRLPESDEMRWSTELIDKQVHAMGLLIDDLMDVSRITHGRIALRREALELSTVVADAVQLAQGMIDGAGHSLSIDVPSQGIRLEADRTRLAQVFANLLTNAAKYTDPAGRIEVHAVAEGNEAVVTVSDNGIGIRPERLEKVFEMFSQEESALSRAGGGLGIGLALSRRLVHLHGGSVRAFSGDGGPGTRMVVRLPLALASANEAATEATTAAKIADTRSMRILVADDNVDAAESLALVLQMEGHTVRLVHDGEAAVAAATSFDPEVVLLDIGMPKLNGFEAGARIRAQPGGASRFLVALTGWGQARDRQRSTEVGFDQHLVKPVPIEQLMQVIAGIAFRKSPTGT